MRPILIILFLLLIGVSAKSQSWQEGYFYDVKGNKQIGLIKLRASGGGPIQDENFIEFKENSKKASSYKLSASELSSVIIGRDSFVVAAAPRTGVWSRYELDFVKVVVDADRSDPKLYMSRAKLAVTAVAACNPALVWV